MGIIIELTSVTKSEPIVKELQYLKMVSEEKDNEVIEFIGQDFMIWRSKCWHTQTGRATRNF